MHKGRSGRHECMASPALSRRRAVWQDLRETSVHLLQVPQGPVPVRPDSQAALRDVPHQ